MRSDWHCCPRGIVRQNVKDGAAGVVAFLLFYRFCGDCGSVCGTISTICETALLLRIEYFRDLSRVSRLLVSSTVLLFDILWLLLKILLLVTFCTMLPAAFFLLLNGYLVLTFLQISC